MGTARSISNYIVYNIKYDTISKRPLAIDTMWPPFRASSLCLPEDGIAVLDVILGVLVEVEEGEADARPGSEVEAQMAVPFAIAEV